ncbi:MAG: trypsin-like peptidase domain-containing protein [Planctomycetota bacterium]|nr:trypsin-like peptidase domain-containing protein [Planctomycetota bacterium]
MNPATPDPVPAGLFHAGNTCPFCQENVAAGQLIVTCPECGSIHHETCWTHKPGCSSYHCEKSGRMANPNLPADFVLTLDEVAVATPLPKRVARGSANVAAAYAPPPPERASKLAFVALGAALLSLVGFVGAISGTVEVVLLGIVVAFIAIAMAVISLVRINNPENRISGMPLAATATVLPVIFVIVFFAVLDASLRRSNKNSHVNLQIRDNLPSEEHLGRMPPNIGNAMRANVVIRFESGPLEQSYGSGIVLKVEDHRTYILTNKHVIGEGKGGKVNVLFYTGEESPGAVEWTAPEGVDLAIVSSQVIAFDKYQPIAIATQPVSAGDGVFAIGNPMGLSWSYTEGIISGLRKVEGGPNGVELYQTQTPINSGNSGGGLYAKDGRLVGVNTLTEDKQFAEGLSFAISMETLLKLLTPEERAKWLDP